MLAVFGDDPAYSKNEQVFPDISRYIFNRLNQTPLKATSEKITQFNQLSFPMVGTNN